MGLPISIREASAEAKKIGSQHFDGKLKLTNALIHHHLDTVRRNPFQKGRRSEFLRRAKDYARTRVTDLECSPHYIAIAAIIHAEANEDRIQSLQHRREEAAAEIAREQAAQVARTMYGVDASEIESRAVESLIKSLRTSYRAKRDGVELVHKGWSYRIVKRTAQHAIDTRQEPYSAEFFTSLADHGMRMQEANKAVLFRWAVGQLGAACKDDDDELRFNAMKENGFCIAEAARSLGIDPDALRQWWHRLLIKVRWIAKEDPDIRDRWEDLGD